MKLQTYLEESQILIEISPSSFFSRIGLIF